MSPPFPSPLLPYQWPSNAVFSRMAVAPPLPSQWPSNAVFSRVAVATTENTSFDVHEWNKIRSYTGKKKKKKKVSVSFMLLFTIIKLLPTLRLSQQKTIFSRHFASIWSCSACLGLGGMILGNKSCRVARLNRALPIKLKCYEIS